MYDIMSLLLNQCCLGGGTGRHSGLKIRWGLAPCRFNSGPRHLRRGMEQLVARRAHNPKAAGSNPAPAIQIKARENFC